MMPGMDAWAILRALKSDPDLEHIPVVMVSIAGDRDLGYIPGAVELLTKPVDRELLHQLVLKHEGPAGSGQALVVEDDEASRSLLRRSFEDEGWEVSEAANGLEALERVADRRPDLILLDLMMPVMDGFSFMLELRQREDGHSIPVIVITSRDLTAEERKTLTGGVEYIVERGAASHDELLQEICSLADRLGRDQTDRDRNGETTSDETD
jgi:CheY-like chemotaxis protein